MDPLAPSATAAAAAAGTVPLPPAVGQALYQAVAAMDADGWADPELLGPMLDRAEALLCALRGSTSLAAYVQQLAGGGGGGGPCTSVWVAGTIAYRCRTCGLSPSAAVCVDCFRASDHEGHDCTMYTSDAGGCCDCGDMSSWRPQGCCPRHRPPGEGHGTAEPPPLPAADDALARGVVGCGLAALQLALEGSLGTGHPPPLDQAALERHKAAALRLMAFLVQLGQAPALRRLVCEELVQPADPAVAEQAGSLAATAALPPEVGAVARMLQQHRASLLHALAAVLPEPGASSQSARNRPLPVPRFVQPRQMSLLYWQMASLLPLDARLVEDLASLHILLLYSTPFKLDYGQVLLTFYPHIGALGKRHPVTRSLDRLTVQVFHLEETTLVLAQHYELLQVLLGCLLDVLRGGLGPNGRVDGLSPVMTGRTYLRIAADLHMVLSHPAVVVLLLAGAQAPLFDSHLLEVFRLMEGASPFRRASAGPARKLGDHVLYESEAWVNVVQVEVHMMHMLKQGVMHTLLKAAEAGTVDPHTAALALAYGLQCSLGAVAATAGVLQTAEEPHGFWAGVLSGQSTMSAHIPLERIATSFLAGLLHLASSSPTPQLYLQAAAQMLGAGGDPLQAAARTGQWEHCGLAAERITGWMSQASALRGLPACCCQLEIRQRLWVRNGQQLLRLETFYASPYWALGYLSVDSGAVHLLRASSAASLEEATEVLQGARGSHELLRCAADWLRLLVILLRERSVWHPTYSPLQLRRSVVHILAAGARSHSEVCEDLPYELAHSPHFDTVLGQVADYQPPTAAATGRYSLKRECWDEFSPFYPHYTRRDLQTALHTAQEVGVWQPEWQLLAPLPPLPAAMAGLLRMQHHMLRIVWAALLLACTDGSSGAGGANSGGGGSGGAAEDCALAACNLLSLALQRKQADLAALAAGDAAPDGAPQLPEAWRSLQGFRSKCEEHLEGSAPDRPGIIHLLRVLAGEETWVDGSRREASWELQRCAAAAAPAAAALLQAARAAAPSEAQPPQAEGQLPAAGEAAQPVLGQPMEPGATPEASPQGEAAARRKAQAKARQQQMLERMRVQQAKAAAALLEESDGEGSDGGGAQHPLQPAVDGMEVDGAEQQGEAAEAAQPADTALPAHHPAAWERHAGAECALCHSGSDTAPLGLVAQLQPTELPVLASVEGAAPLTPEHPGMPGGGVCAVQPPAPFPLPGAGPRLSVFDRNPSWHLLCCGHMLHAGCLERYRASWRQRIAAGQFVEGFQLLQPSVTTGEYLCPICRRLGNCLLPLAPAPQPGGDAAAAPPCLNVQEATQRLEELLAQGEANWAAAPATSSAELLQQAQEQGASPVSLRHRLLVRQYGPQAAAVEQLCLAAQHAGLHWIMEQGRALRWLQKQAATREAPLWGIPVTPSAEPAPGGAAQSPAQSLQAALQQILDQAAGAEEPDLAAIGVFAEAAAVMAAEIEEEAMMGEQEGSEGSEAEGSDGDIASDDEAAAAEVAAGGVPQVLQQLQHQMAVAAGEEPPAGWPDQAVPAPHPDDDSEHQRVVAQHCARLKFERGPDPAGSSSLLWSLLGSGVVQWEVAHRDPACAPSPEADAAHWRALQSLAQLAVASSVPGVHSLRAEQAAAQDAGRPRSLRTLLAVSGVPTPTAALLPSVSQLELPPAEYQHTRAGMDGMDPYELMLCLLASALSGGSWAAEQASQPHVRLAHRKPAEVLRALVAAMHPVVVMQAATLATGGSRSAADVAAAVAASAPLASALESAIASQLLPWLQRAAVLLALFNGTPAPGPPITGDGAAVPAAAAALQALGLPSVAAALASMGASGAPLPVPPSRWLPSSTMQLSVHAAGQQWSVALLPLPAAPRLLQLPPSYQDWYLSLGTRKCSACGQAPSEPALCLRCGTVICCNGRRCLGPHRQGMCYTHAQACGGGTCAYLLAKMTRLLVLRKNRATFLPSPYVDNHGEEDMRLQRGKPLSLHAERLRNLVQLWRGCLLDYDSQVLHAANHRNEFASVY